MCLERCDVNRKYVVNTRGSPGARCDDNDTSGPRVMQGTRFSI